MKRIISFIMTVLTVMSTMVFAVSADAGTCLKLTDTSSGAIGYAQGTSAISEKIKAEGGVTLMFDVYVESVASVPSGDRAEITTFTGSGYNYVSYDLISGKFTADTATDWVADGSKSLTNVASKDCAISTGMWYQMAFRFDGNTAYAYLNGTLMMTANFSSNNTDYIILYPRYCTLLIDNVKICAKDYDVASASGTVWGTETFEAQTTTSSSSVWYAGSDGYTLYDHTNGKDYTGGTDSGIIGQSVDFSTKITTALELANRSAYVALNYKTLYVMGCFGAPMTDANKTRYTNNHSYNMTANRAAMIMAASSDTFGFDCVCFIKALLWGWCGDTSKTYGGASYASNGVPDVSADGMIALCSDVSTDFSTIEVGEVVWMSGHIGVYIGGGLAVECTPKWDNCVQITAVGNIGTVSGYNTRTWTKHGKLPYVTYSGITDATLVGS